MWRSEYSRNQLFATGFSFQVGSFQAVEKAGRGLLGRARPAPIERRKGGYLIINFTVGVQGGLEHSAWDADKRVMVFKNRDDSKDVRGAIRECREMLDKNPGTTEFLLSRYADSCFLQRLQSLCQEKSIDCDIALKAFEIFYCPHGTNVQAVAKEIGCSEDIAAEALAVVATVCVSLGAEVTI